MSRSREPNTSFPMDPSRGAFSILLNNVQHVIAEVSVRRLGILKGAHLLEAPLKSVSFGTFLAETRKVRIVRLFVQRQESNILSLCCTGDFPVLYYFQTRFGEEFP